MKPRSRRTRRASGSGVVMGVAVYIGQVGSPEFAPPLGRTAVCGQNKPFLLSATASCSCSGRPPWARVEDDRVMQWPVVELAEWEELRQCPECTRAWLAVWPEELEGGMILCRPEPASAKRLR